MTPRLVLAIADKGEFGPCCAGSFVDRPLILSNGAKCLLSITDVISSSAAFVVPEVLSYPPSVAPGAALSLPIRFAPTSLGGKSGTLTVTSNDPAGPRRIDVTGDAPPGKLSVTGLTISAASSVARASNVPCHCATPAPANCMSPRSRCAASTRHSALISNPFPATLRPGSCLSVVLQYHAIEKEARACELVIHSDNSNAPITCLDVVAHTIWNCCCGRCDEPRSHAAEAH